MSSFSFTLLYQFTKTGAVSVWPGKSLSLLVSVVFFFYKDSRDRRDLCLRALLAISTTWHQSSGLENKHTN